MTILGNMRTYKTNEPSVEFIKDILDYDPETGLLTWRIAPTMRRKSRRGGQVAGTMTATGYVAVMLGPGILHRAHRLAWVLAYGAWPQEPLDHINGVRDDNRLRNLRLATSSLNGANKGMQRNNTSGYVGVNFFAQNQKWEARITRRRVTHRLGLFDTAIEAHRAREHFLKELKDEDGPADPHRKRYAHPRDKRR